MNVPGNHKVRGIVLLLGLIVSVAGCASRVSGGSTASAADGVLARITPMERQMLADRHVTFTEYSRATQATISCLRAGGYTVSSPVPGVDGTLQYMASYSFGGKSSKTGPSQDQKNRASAIENNCDQKSAAVQAVYILDHAVSAKEIPRAFSHMVACFRRSGVKIPGSGKLSEFAAVMRSARLSVRDGNLTQARFTSCQADFMAAELQPLPGLAQALANMKDP